MRRCSRGWCCAAILTPHCSDSACSRSGVQCVAGHQRRRRWARQVVLRDERLQHLLLGAARHLVVIVTGKGAVGAVSRKVRTVAEVATAAHHRQVDAGAAALQLDGQDVDVALARRQAALVHRLLVQHARQRADLVAHRRRLLELQRIGHRHHAALQRVHHLVGLAEQESFGIGHVAGVALLVDEAHARRTAALNLVQQARPRAVREHRVLAGAQAKHLLQQLDRLLHRPRTWIRSEVLVPTIDAAAVVRHPRVLVRHQLQVRVALVVAKQDVEARRQRLDQVVLEQQRLGLAAHHRRLQPHDAAHHHADARALVVFVEVAGHALLQVARLADIEHLVGRVEESVDTRQRRQGRHFGEQRLARGVGSRFLGHRWSIIGGAPRQCGGALGPLLPRDR